MNDTAKIIVIGIGNVLLSDEGVGVRVVERIKTGYDFPPNVEVYDGGATGMMGLLPLIEDADHLIVIDAVNGAGRPGSLYRFTIDDFKLTMPKKMSAHDVGLVECLAMTEITGRSPESVVILGVKPEDIKTFGMTLSDTVEAKLDDLEKMVLGELRSLGVKPVHLHRSGSSRFTLENRRVYAEDSLENHDLLLSREVGL